MQLKQPVHLSASTSASFGSRVSSSAAKSEQVLAAAADAIITESGMSLGKVQAPAMKIPFVRLSTGCSFGWTSL